MEEQIRELEQRRKVCEAKQLDTEKFLQLAKEQEGFPELTADVMKLFVDKILVHEKDWSTGVKEQEIDIYFNFIGNYQLPQPEITPEEALKLEQKRQKKIDRRSKRVAYMRKWNAEHKKGNEINE